jgi:hypothetical protein
MGAAGATMLYRLLGASVAQATLSGALAALGVVVGVACVYRAALAPLLAGARALARSARGAGRIGVLEDTVGPNPLVHSALGPLHAAMREFGPVVASKVEDVAQNGDPASSGTDDDREASRHDR